jgi:hypothetical protein
LNYTRGCNGDRTADAPEFEDISTNCWYAKPGISSKKRSQAWEQVRLTLCALESPLTEQFHAMDDVITTGLWAVTAFHNLGLK